MNTLELVKEVEKLIRMAASSTKSDDALKFSQGAVNAANALAQLNHVINQ